MFPKTVQDSNARVLLIRRFRFGEANGFTKILLPKTSERMIDPQHSEPGRRYRWPWLLLAALIIGIVLTVLWVLGAVRKVKQIRESTGQSASVTPSYSPQRPKVVAPVLTNGMVWIPSGTFLMGSDDGQ